MKQYIVLITLCLMSIGSIYGQGIDCPDSVGISTDPRLGLNGLPRAYNLERGNAFRNTFDWMAARWEPTRFAAGTPFAGITYYNSPYRGFGTDCLISPSHQGFCLHW